LSKACVRRNDLAHCQNCSKTPNRLHKQKSRLVFLESLTMSLTMSNRSSIIDPLTHLVEVASSLARLPLKSTPAKSASKKSDATVSPCTAHNETDYFSVVSNDEEESQKRNESSPLSLQGYSKREVFPQRLLCILNDPSLSDVVTWLPHGRSFVIIRPDVFMEEVLPKYLPPADAKSSTKYASFTRKLNRW
jgi:hypothetical protein